MKLTIDIGNTQIKFPDNAFLGAGGDASKWQIFPSASSNNSEGNEFTMVNNKNGWVFHFDKSTFTEQLFPSCSFIEVVE